MKCHSDQLTLDELIFLLKKQKQDRKVEFDFAYFSPDLDSIGSYRGFYEDLAIGFKDHDYDDRPTVKQLREALEKMIGTKITGYKGGDYTVTNETAVWCANWSETGSVAVVNVEEINGGVVIVTRKIAY